MEVKVDASDLARVAKVLRGEADGKQLRKELVADLKAAVAPGAAAVADKLRAIPHASASTAKPPLGSYLAARTKVQVRTGGRATGVAVRIQRTPNLRGFTFAAKRLNRDSWRHPVFGSDRWVDQDSPIRGYFDDTLSADREKYRAAVLEVLTKLAKRIARRH